MFIYRVKEIKLKLRLPANAAYGAGSSPKTTRNYKLTIQTSGQSRT